MGLDTKLYEIFRPLDHIPFIGPIFHDRESSLTKVRKLTSLSMVERRSSEQSAAGDDEMESSTA